MTHQHDPDVRGPGRPRFLQTGEVASAAGVNVQTLRYYERRGLLARPERSSAGHRRYPPHTVTMLRMIKNAQRLGLRLDEIAELITDNPGATGIPAVSERKLAEIDAQIAQLTLIRKALATYVSPTSGLPER